MLHLAQVQKNPTSGEIELQLLAQETRAKVWQISNSKVLSIPQAYTVHEGMLVLVEVEEGRIIKIKTAKDWLINLIEKYLTQEPITPEFLEIEQARIEQWRQEMTLQSLDLTRRHLEIETHRDQLQELETQLREEQKLLESRWQELKKLEAELEARQEATDEI